MDTTGHRIHLKVQVDFIYFDAAAHSPRPDVMWRVNLMREDNAKYLGEKTLESG